MEKIMLKSCCIQLQLQLQFQVLGQGINFTRSNFVLRRNSSKKCRFSSFNSPTQQFTNNQVANSRSWNLDNRQCLSHLCSGIDLQRENLMPNKGIQTVGRSLVHHFKLQQSLFSWAALDEKQQGAENAQETSEQPSISTEETGQNNRSWKEETYPSGEFEYEKIEGWNSFLVKLKMLIALPWERIKKGSILNMKLRGQV